MTEKIHKPAFPQDLQLDVATLTAANTTLTDSPDDTALLLTAGSEGNEVYALYCLPRATLTAGNLYVYLSTDAGTTNKMIGVIAHPGGTVSTSVAPVVAGWTWPDGDPISKEKPLYVPPTARLYVGYSQAIADGLDVVAMSAAHKAQA